MTEVYVRQMSIREQADITQVTKRGEGYRVRGVSKGKSAEFYVDAASLEKMSRKDAESFMKRSIANIARHEE